MYSMLHASSLGRVVTKTPLNFGFLIFMSSAC